MPWVLVVVPLSQTKGFLDVENGFFTYHTIMSVCNFMSTDIFRVCVCVTDVEEHTEAPNPRSRIKNPTD
jgi:hypothetical protein